MISMSSTVATEITGLISRTEPGTWWKGSKYWTSVAILLNANLCAGHIVRPKKTKNKVFCSRERFISGPNKENGRFMLKNTKHPRWFSGKHFYWQFWACDFLLIGWLWGNRALSYHFPPGWEPYFLQKSSDIVMYIPWGGTRILI